MYFRKRLIAILTITMVLVGVMPMGVSACTAMYTGMRKKTKTEAGLRDIPMHPIAEEHLRTAISIDLLEQYLLEEDPEEE